MSGSDRTNNMVPVAVAKSNAADNADVILWADPSTHRLLVDASVSITLTTDNSAFVAGTTGGTPAMGFYHSTIDAVTDGRTAALAIDAKRNLFVVIRDAAGNARGLNVDASGNVGVTATLQTQTDTVMVGGINVKEINAVAPSMGNGVSGTGVQRVTIASDSTGVVGLAAGIAEIGNVKNSGTFAVQATPVTQVDTFMLGGVNIKEINATAPTMGNGTSGTGVLRVTIASDSTGILAGVTTVTTVTTVSTITGGGVAHDGVDSGNPIKMGARAISAEISPVAAADRTDLLADLAGKLIVMPYANPENFVSGAITSAMTGTTSTSLIGSPGGALRNYITNIVVSNSHATVGTDVLIQDGNGGTTLYVIPAAAVFGGASVTFPVPLRQPTTATAIYVANVTTGANVKVSASGYKGV